MRVQGMDKRNVIMMPWLENAARLTALDKLAIISSSHVSEVVQILSLDSCSLSLHVSCKEDDKYV